MIVIDRLLVGGIKFVLGKIATAVEAEMNNEEALREELLAAQMKVELGELSEEEFSEVEARVLAQLREIRDRKRAVDADRDPRAELRIAGVEASVFEGDVEP